MSDLTYFEVLELQMYKEKCITLGIYYKHNNIQYDKEKLNVTELLYIEFGRFCEYYELDSSLFINYEKYLECGGIEWNVDNKEFDSIEENQLYTFIRRLKIGEYKVILFNEEIPMVNDEHYNSMVGYVFDELREDSVIEVGFDTLKIIQTNGEEIFLEGLEEISEGEIFARRFLNKCEYDTLIVKDFLGQVDFEDHNYKDIKKDNYYCKCKDITNIRTMPEDSEHYNMNYGNIIVGYGEEDFFEEIWQQG
jgi:hypothetical protein